MSENVIANINGYTITEADVDNFIETLPNEQKQYAANPQFRGQISQQLVALVLFSEYAKEEKMEETEDYAKLLESAKRDILAQLAVQKVISAVEVTDADVEAFYNENQDRFQAGETVSARHILVAEEAECKAIKADIESGAKTFEEAAKESSTCPSKDRGGDLGSFGHGQMVPEFDQAAFAAEVNAIVGPVKTQFGYHLIQVYEKSESTVAPLAQVADQIKSHLTQMKQSEVYNEKVAELHEKYSVN